MSAEEKDTTAAPNNTTGQAETAVVPENKEVVSEPAPAAAVATAAADAEGGATANGDTAPAKADPTPEPTPETDEKPKASATTPIQQLWELAKAHGHPEMWGVQLADPEHDIPTQIILQKFLNAYDGDLAKAKDVLTKSLTWRKETKPLDLLAKAHAKAKFGGLGYVTTYGRATAGEPESKEVFTWNIYGGVKDINSTFGDLKE